jgi:putative transposase
MACSIPSSTIEVDKPEIERIHRDNYGAYGARKMWLALNREGITVARCTVAG